MLYNKIYAVKRKPSYAFCAGWRNLHIATEFFAQAGCPTLEPYAVVGIKLRLGTDPLDHIAGVVAQRGGQADDYGHKRPEHDILKAVTVLMLQ